MRKIKFRAKVKMPEKRNFARQEYVPEGQWVYGEPHTIDCPTPHIHTVDVGKQPIDKETVGHFIGVYDKNGKEVYEGDIVDCWSEGRHCTNGIVKWMQNRIWIASTWDIWNLMPNKNGIDEGLIVVGNIYDNPELMEGGEKCQ